MRRDLAGTAGTAGPPGPPGAPGLGSDGFNTQDVADRVLTLMNGECSRWTSG